MGYYCSRVELVTTVVVDHHSTNPRNDQAHCFPNVPLRDRERSSAASASEGKVERIDLTFLSNQQVRAFAHSAPALQSEDYMCLIPPIWLLHLITRQGRLIPPLLLLLKIATSRTCPSTVRWVIFTTELRGVVTFREYVGTVAPLPTVDVKSVTVVRMTVARQSLNKA